VAVWAIEASCAFLFRVETRTRATRMGISLRAVQPVWKTGLECGGQCSLEVRCSQIPSRPQILHNFNLLCSAQGIHWTREHASGGPERMCPVYVTRACQHRIAMRGKENGQPPTTKCVQRPELIGLFWTKVTRAFETSRQ